MTLLTTINYSTTSISIFFTSFFTIALFLYKYKIHIDFINFVIVYSLFKIGIIKSNYYNFHIFIFLIYNLLKQSFLNIIRILILNHIK